MRIISFPIISKNKSWFARFLIFSLILIVGVNFILQFEKNPYKDMIISVSFGLIVGTAAVIDLLAIANRRKLSVFDSSVYLSDSGIRLDIKGVIQNFTLEELNSVTLTINETSFDPYLKGFINKRKSGTENWLEVRVIGDIYYKYRIYIDSADEIEKLDLFLEQLGEKKYHVRRSGKKITSIKKAHYTDIPLHYRETRRSRN